MRLDYSAKLGRPVSVQEVADAAGIARTALTRIELNQTERIDFDTLLKLCTFYGVSPAEVLAVEEIISPALAAA